MAVQRDAQTVNFGNAPQVAAVPNAVGFKSPDVAKYQNNDTAPELRPSGLSTLVDLLAKPVYQKAVQEVGTARQEAYLAGSAAAAAGRSQDEVDSNIITKDWATAGYSDTRGRLALADATAQTSVDMTKLREQSPAQMQEYLAEKRRQLEPYMEGMSQQAREGFFAQQLTSDRAAIALHTNEHQKFIIDQIGKGITTDLTTRFSQMDKAKTDAVSYGTQTEDTVASMWSNIWNNPNLPEKNKVELTTQSAIAALNGNHQLLYEQMRDSKMPDGTTMLSKLPFDDQVKLSKGYEQSRKDTSAMRLGDFAAQRGLMEAGFDDPLAPAMSYNDVQAFLQQGVQIGAIKESDITSITKAWANGNEKKLKSADMGNAWAAGDAQKLFSVGGDDEKGAKAYVSIQARNNAPVSQTVGNLMQIGYTTGSQAAWKTAAELVRGPVSTIGRAEQIDPSQLQILDTVFNTLDKAEFKDKSKTAQSAFLSAFDEDTRATLMLYREKRQAGKAPQVAADETRELLNTQSSLDSSTRAARANANAAADTKIVDELTPQSLWGVVTDTIGGVFKSGTSARNKLSVYDGWFSTGNGEVAAQKMAQGRTALQEELQYISRSNPLMPDDVRSRTAYAAVANRSLMLDGGPLILPRIPGGQTKQDYFGVPRSTTDSSIVEALNQLHTPGKGNTVVYSTTGQGQLKWQEYGPHGELMNPGQVFDPRSVAGKIQELQDKRTDEFSRTNGAGVTRSDRDGGATVQYNGDNTTGVDNKLMLEYRDSLVNHEGVKSVPYDDASGKVVNGKRVQTVGVGVSTTNPEHYPKVGPDGKVSQEDINNSFMTASNAAAVVGRKAQVEALNSTPQAFKLFAELSYQGGHVPEEFLAAMKSRKVDEALKALHNTPQFKQAHDERKSYYDNLTKGALL